MRGALLVPAIVLGSCDAASGRTMTASPLTWILKGVAKEAGESATRRAVGGAAREVIEEGAAKALVRDAERAAVRDAEKTAGREAEKAAVRNVEKAALRDAATLAEHAALSAREGSRAATEHAVIRHFDEVRPGTHWLNVVPEDVKEFVTSLERGFRNPEQYLHDRFVDPELVAKWNATPVENRVIIAGSSEDAPLIAKVKAQLESEGKAVFFFAFCARAPKRLCPSETIGALHATAGRGILVDTPAARKSRYVTQEISAALRLKAGQRPVFLVTGKELGSAIGGTAAALAGGTGWRSTVQTRVRVGAVPAIDDHGPPFPQAGAAHARETRK